MLTKQMHWGIQLCKWSIADIFGIVLQAVLSSVSLQCRSVRDKSVR